MKIVVVNAGSSSHKLAFYDINNEKPVEALWQGSYEWGREDLPPTIDVKTSKGRRSSQTLLTRDVELGLRTLLNTLWQGDTAVIDNLSLIEKIGHRVVHGGDGLVQPTLINDIVKGQIDALSPLAPLHNPANLKGIELMQQFFPHLDQIAVFDTAFHVTMPEEIKTYPVPWEWKEWGIQRYGFHGISHHYCAERTVDFLKLDKNGLKMITCHLGNGCSLCAIKEGKSFETTMGLTPLEGLMMGTRCGSIDPGILLYLLRERGMKQEELDHSLNFSSGLKGVAGYSDMRELLEKKDERTELAVQMFIHRLKTAIGSLTASLGGLDVLIFTAGIGEHSPIIREKTCKGLDYLGVLLDDSKNQACRPDVEISGIHSKVKVLVLHTEEEWMIAKACFNFHSP